MDSIFIFTNNWGITKWLIFYLTLTKLLIIFQTYRGLLSQYSSSVGRAPGLRPGCRGSIPSSLTHNLPRFFLFLAVPDAGTEARNSSRRLTDLFPAVYFQLITIENCK